MSRLISTIKREVKLALRVFREPAPHALNYELALNFNNFCPATERVPVPATGGAKEMVAFSACVFQRQIEDLLAMEDAGKYSSLDRKGHLVRIADSTIPEAGEGVFANRRLEPGTVVCLYPGTLYPPRGHFGGAAEGAAGFSLGGFGDGMEMDVEGELHDQEEEEEAMGQKGKAGNINPSGFYRPPKDSVFVMARPGGFKIDASTVAKGDALNKLLSKRTMAAVGHKIQHPPRAQVEPNVVEVPVLYRICLRPLAEGLAEAQKAREEEKRKEERKRLVRSSFLFASLDAQATSASPSVALKSSSGDEGKAESFSPAAHMLSRSSLPYEGVRVDFHQRHRVPHWFAPYSAPDSSPIPHQMFHDSHFQRHLSFVSVGRKFGSLTAHVLVGGGGTDPPDLEPAVTTSALGTLLKEQRESGVMTLPPFVVVPGIAMVAARAIDPNEELFLDYGLIQMSDDNPLPSWYQEVPIETTRRILKQAKKARIERSKEAGSAR